MTIFQTLDRLNMETWQVGYEECLKNVDQYIHDVRTLIDRKSYGHALGLAVLGNEELAKATGYFMISSGIVDANDEAGKKFLRLLHKKHELKIGFAYELLFVPEMISKFKGLVPGIVKEHAKQTRNKEELMKLTYEELFDNPEFKMMGGERKGEEIQRLKLEGLYVGIDKNGGVITPNKITKEEAISQLKELEGNREIIGELPVWSNQVSPQDSLIFKEWIKESFWKPIAKKLEKSKI
jgi:AbiV family abortive infection protein